ncbi:hypothetical protein HDU92_005817 [Lobulomyces angularis]|nr:hypothetical protein HDU92_005817 [Lobulomyces angularis]
MNLSVLAFLLLLTLVSTQAICSDSREFCLFSKEEDQQVRFKLVANQKLGYVAVGFGRSMDDAKIFAASVVNGKVKLTTRYSSSHSEPEIKKNVANAINTKNEGDAGFSVEFTVPKSELKYTGGQLDLIWAFSEDEQDGNSISYHGENKGTNKANLFSSSSDFDYKATTSNLAQQSLNSEYFDNESDEEDYSSYGNRKYKHHNRYSKYNKHYHHKKHYKKKYYINLDDDGDSSDEELDDFNNDFNERGIGNQNFDVEGSYSDNYGYENKKHGGYGRVKRYGYKKHKKYGYNNHYDRHHHKYKHNKYGGTSKNQSNKKHDDYEVKKDSKKSYFLAEEASLSDFDALH